MSVAVNLPKTDFGDATNTRSLEVRLQV